MTPEITYPETRRDAVVDDYAGQQVAGMTGRVVARFPVMQPDRLDQLVADADQRGGRRSRADEGDDAQDVLGP